MGEKVICSQCKTDAEPSVLVLKSGALVYPETYRLLPGVPMDTPELRVADPVCAPCVYDAARRGVCLSLLFCLLLQVLLPVTALAQEVPAPPPAAPEEEFRLPEPGDLVPLRRGAAAPHDGLLIEAADMLQIHQEYERMRYLLTRTAERDAETCDVRVEMEHARLTACEERLHLRDELWTARQAELTAQIVEARAEARRAAERGWYENVVLWFVIGVVATGAVWIAVEATP